jgi:hypothetical protein
MKSILVIAATTLGLGLLAPNANAALITGVTASTTLGSGAGTNIANALNGQGLPGNTPALSGNHASSGPSDTWVSAEGTLTGNITFDLNGSYSLAGFSFWNFIGANNTIGIRGVTVQSSTDGVSFSAIAGAPTQFTQGINVPQPPEVISFPPFTASYVRFVVGSNWGNNAFTGFSEVQFNGTPAPVATTPEPASILGLLAVGGGLLATKRRKG